MVRHVVALTTKLDDARLLKTGKFLNTEISQELMPGPRKTSFGALPKFPGAARENRGIKPAAERSFTMSKLSNIANVDSIAVPTTGKIGVADSCAVYTWW